MDMPPFRSGLALEREVGGIDTGPNDSFRGMLSMGPVDPGIRWAPPRGAGGAVRTRPVAARFGDGAPGPVSDVSGGNSTMGYVDAVFHTPSIGYDHVAEMQQGMLAFAVRRKQQEEGATLIMSLHQVNAAMREQWADFLLYTTPGGGNQDSEALEFLRYMQLFGERGLELYAHMLNESTRYKSVSPFVTAVVENVELQNYHRLAQQDDFCYLTRWGIRQRVRYVGPIMGTTRERTLDDMGQERYAVTSSVVVGAGRRVPCTQIFGPRHSIRDGSRLWLICTRTPCEPTKFGAFRFLAGGGGLRDGPTDAERTYRDESGALCRGDVRWVGTVNRAPFKESSPYAITQATNTGAVVNNDAAVSMHLALPMMHINSGMCG